MIKTPRSEEKKFAVPMSSLKDARVVVESGHPEGWGRVLDLPPKFTSLVLVSVPPVKVQLPELQMLPLR